VSADWLLVVAAIGDRPVQCLVRADDPRVEVRPLTCLDLSPRLAEVVFHDVEVPSDAVVGEGDGPVLEWQLALAVALSCTETVGALDALLGMTVAYAKDRTAFGRPIGSFQALKHVLADQSLGLEVCAAAAAAAVQAVEEGDPDAGAIASMAAAYVGDVSNEVAQECLQVHGGIGYTWEHDLHLYLRRVRSNAALYGTPSWHRERVCALQGLGREAGG
jgi:alkylation response protein AidB-like acyl-CoA dehydrogenase